MHIKQYIGANSSFNLIPNILVNLAVHLREGLLAFIPLAHLVIQAVVEHTAELRAAAVRIGV